MIINKYNLYVIIISKFIIDENNNEYFSMQTLDNYVINHRELIDILNKHLGEVNAKNFIHNIITNDKDHLEYETITEHLRTLVQLVRINTNDIIEAIKRVKANNKTIEKVQQAQTAIQQLFNSLKTTELQLELEAEKRMKNIIKLNNSNQAYKKTNKGVILGNIDCLDSEL